MKLWKFGNGIREVIEYNTLQWGRDRSIAEMNLVLSGDYPMDTLQWGRDRSIAEMRNFSGRDAIISSCFNGAAIDRSRK